MSPPAKVDGSLLAEITPLLQLSARRFLDASESVCLGIRDGSSSCFCMVFFGRLDLAVFVWVF